MNDKEFALNFPPDCQRLLSALNTMENWSYSGLAEALKRLLSYDEFVEVVGYLRHAYDSVGEDADECEGLSD